MIDAYWAEVGVRVEAIRNIRWAYLSKMAARDRAMYDRMREMRKRRHAKKLHPRKKSA